MTLKKRSADDPLVAMHRGPHLTQSALAAVLKYVRDNGVPPAVSESSQRRARRKYAMVDTDYGPVVQQLHLEGGAEDVYVLHPFALLQRTTKECAPFRELLLETLKAKPCSAVAPWGLIIYFDGISPTNALSLHIDERKIESFYWTFREFVDHLSNDILWFVVSCAREVTVQELEAGMSELVYTVLRQLFFNDANHNFASSGVRLEYTDDDGVSHDFRLFAVHSQTIADALALKEVLHSMGHNGLRPCPKCLYITKDDVADGVKFLPLSSLDCGRFVQRDDADLRSMHAFFREEKARLSATEFAKVESRKGFHYSERSLISDPRFHPLKTLIFDWPHIWYSNGLLYYELDAFMTIAREATPKNKSPPITYDTLHEYFEQYIWPDRFRATNQIFSQGRLSATASEQHSCMPVLRNFFNDVVLNVPEVAHLHDGARSMIALCDAADALELAWRRANTGQQLHNSIYSFTVAHQRAYGKRFWHWKHHAALHLGNMYNEHGFLPNSFVTEKRHKEPKRFAMSNRSGRSYEKSLMEELCCQHLYDWKAYRVAPLRHTKELSKNLRTRIGEIFPHAIAPKTARMFVATSGLRFSVGDLALFGNPHPHGTCGMIWYFIDVDGVAWVCASMWELLRKPDIRHGRYRMHAENPQLFFASDLHSLCIFRRHDSGEATVVWPPLYRSRG